MGSSGHKAQAAVNSTLKPTRHHTVRRIFIVDSTSSFVTFSASLWTDSLRVDASLPILVPALVKLTISMSSVPAATRSAKSKVSVECVLL